MKLDPPILIQWPFVDRVYVVTHGRVEPHPTIDGQRRVIPSRQYDVTDQFTALAERRSRAARRPQRLKVRS